MYDELLTMDCRPGPFEFYTAEELWNDDHISKKMLEFHLNGDVDPASRRTEFVRRSVEWIAGEFGVGPGCRVADFGCGPGLYTTPFARKGAEVTGIDFSARSIAHARKTAQEAGLEIDYTLGNYLEFSSDKRFDLITLIYCDFCALGPAQRKRLLEIFRDHLSDGGRLLLDVCSLKALEGRTEDSSFGRNLMDGFWSAEDYIGFLRTFIYEDESVVLDKYTIVEPGMKRVIFNWLQYFTVEGIAGELEAGGFRVDARLSNVAGDLYSDDSPEIAIVGSRG